MEAFMNCTETSLIIHAPGAMAYIESMSGL
jgi:hypothetical protein